MITIRNQATWKADIKLVQIGRKVVAVDSRMGIYREVWNFGGFIARHRPSRLPA